MLAYANCRYYFNDKNKIASMAVDSQIREIIKNQGYITIDNMMREVLSLNKESYYRSVKNIGAAGDFITAPEISQMFGEIIGIWVTTKWQDLGKPAKIILLELGPGQGILMRDILKTLRITPELFQALKICLYDINPYFIAKQKDNLEPYEKEIIWLNKIDDIPASLPIIVIANEFFDALPIKQYIKIKDLWYESILAIDPADGMIKFDKIEVHKTLQKQLLLDHPSAHDGAVVEESVESLDIIRLLASRIVKNTGSTLIIDYGYNIDKARSRRQYHSTLQAVKGHKYSSIIDTLGEADLSAHVDFQGLAKAAHEYGIIESNISTQAEFLTKYGILHRLESLKNKAPGYSHVLERQLRRLISEQEMGVLFKVLEFQYQLNST